MPRHPPNALLKRLIIKSRPPRTGANPKAKATDLTQLQPECIRSKKHATRGTRPKRDFPNRKIPHFSAPRGFLSTMPNNLPRSNKEPAKLFLPTRRTSIGHTRPEKRPEKRPGTGPKGPAQELVEPTGIEPVTSSLQS